MTRNEGRTPRKTPRQARSRATVDAILEAVAYILARDGYAGLTTNRVAERAGVNIASLYQFFPNKAALITELQRRHVEESRAAADKAVAAARHRGIPDIMAAFVRSALASHAVNPTLHRVFAEELPGRWMRDVVALAPDPVQVQLEEWLRELGRPPADAERIAWMLRTVSRAVIHDAIMERPEDLRSGRLAKELENLLCCYLRRDQDKSGDGLEDQTQAGRAGA
jgi:AcrR family transcriptional regulator